MRFGDMGRLAQFTPGSEGYVLYQSGLLHMILEDGDPIGYEPTNALREMFDRPFELEAAYPLLVEMVMAYRYRSDPAFVDARDVERRLRGMGMAEVAVDGLRNILGGMVRAR